jgi:hypothetical protein
MILKSITSTQNINYRKYRLGLNNLGNFVKLGASTNCDTIKRSMKLQQ